MILFSSGGASGKKGRYWPLGTRKAVSFSGGVLTLKNLGGVLLLGGPDDEPINLKEEEPGTYEIMGAAICMQRRFIRGPLYEKKEDEE